MPLTSINVKNESDTSTLLEDIRDALLEFQELIELGGTATGEVNTGRNVGPEDGIGVFLGKSGVYLEFKKIRSQDDLIQVTNNTEESSIDLTIAEGNIDHDALANVGLNDHTAIDAHIVDELIHTPLNDLVTASGSIWSSAHTQETIVDISGSLQAEIEGRELAFEKNTAFNKDFGIVSGSVCDGADSRLGLHIMQFELGGTLEVSCIGHYYPRQAQELTFGYVDVIGKPSGSNIEVDIRKNTAAASGSILATPISITPDATLINGHYSEAVAINENLSYGDMLYFFVSDIGSEVAGNDLTLQVVFRDA